MGNIPSIKERPEDRIILSKVSLWSRFKDAISSTLEDGVGGVDYSEIEEIGWAFRIASIYSIFYAFLLIYFTATQTIAISKASYLSLDDSDPAQVCKVLPQTMSAQFYGTYDGYWSTNPDYDLNKSIFVLSFQGASISNEEFTSTFNEFRENMNHLGQKGMNRTQLWNTIAWGTFGYSKNNLEFYSSADAGVFMNFHALVATVSSRNGICPNPLLSGTFDTGSKSLSLFVPLNETIASTYMTTIGSSTRNPSNANYSKYLSQIEPCPLQGLFVAKKYARPSLWSTYRTGGFNLDFDSRSLVSAIALNLNLIDTSTFVKKITPVSASYHSYLLSDPYYVPAMAPLMCINKDDPFWKLAANQRDGPEICFIPQNGDTTVLFFYPTSTQVVNVNDYEMIPCLCPKDENDQQCNTNDFFFGLIYDLNFNFTALAYNIGIKMQKLILDDEVNGDVNVINTLAPMLTYTASVAYDLVTANVTQPLSQGNTTLNKILQQSYDKICPTCGAAVFELFAINADLLGTTGSANKLILPINQFGVELSDLSNATYPVLVSNKMVAAPRAMCVNSLSQQSAMQMLGVEAPVRLIQEYFECSLKMGPSFSQALGIAAGNASLYTSVFIFVFGFMFVKYIQIVKKVKLTPKKDLKAKQDLYLEKRILLEQSLLISLAKKGIAKGDNAEELQVLLSEYEVLVGSETYDTSISRSSRIDDKFTVNNNPLYAI